MATNGMLPDSALSDAGPPAGARLSHGAASSWAQVRALVLRDYGWLPMPTSAADCYRPYHIQERIFRARYTTSWVTGQDPRSWQGQTWWRIPGNASAATPGKSNHGWGNAVDVTGLGGFRGLRFTQFAVVARSLGWSNAEGASIDEPWHWVYIGTPGNVSNPGGNVGTLPEVPDLDLDPIEPILEVLMAGPVRIRLDSGAIAMADVSTGAFYNVPGGPGQEDFDGIIQGIAGVPMKPVNQRQWDVIKAVCASVRTQLRG